MGVGMTANLYDHARRLYDLEVALEAMARTLTGDGQLPLVQEAARKARAAGVRGAAELLEGQRTLAPYRR